MHRTFITTERFRRAYHRLSSQQQELVEHSLKQLVGYFETGHAPGGLGRKKLGPGVFEVRAGLGLRVVSVEDGKTVVLALLGNHDEVRQFLKRQ